MMLATRTTAASLTRIEPSRQRLHHHRGSSSNSSRVAAARAAATMGSEGSGREITLVSFDVDGTLIHSVGEQANRLHKEAFSAAFKRCFGLDAHIDMIPHHGGTDPLIAAKVLMHCGGVPKETALARLPEINAAMVEHFEAHRARAGLGLELLPGVERLLAALAARGDVASCLVTGNLEPIGWGKMAALGVDGLFTTPRFGGFGSDHCSGDTDEMWRDRAEFVRIAARRCAEALPGATIASRWHVGDTPMDVRAALRAGARALGVATGICSAAELEAAARAEGAKEGDYVILESLADTAAVLAALGLK